MSLTPRVSRAQVGAERLVWRGLLGETALEVRSVGETVRVGAAGESAAVSVTLRASDTRRFADSLLRRLTPGRLRDSVWTLRVEEPGVSAGALSVSPAGRGADRQRRYRLFVADDPLTTVRQVLDAREVTLFLRQLRAAAQAVPRRTAPRVTKRPRAGRGTAARARPRGAA